MERNRIIYIGITIGMLVLAAGLTYADNQKIPNRYHQHQEQPGEGDMGTCTQCQGKANFCTHLPVIRIETNGAKIPGRPIAGEDGKTVGYETGDNGEEEVPVLFSTVDKEGIWHHENDVPTHESRALIRVRGNTSRWFDKANYKIELVEDKPNYPENPLPLLGMTSGSEWALYGPFLDKTLMRNYLCLNLSAEIMGYAPNVRLCEVFLDRQYQGVYLLMETISVQDGRVTLTPYKDGDVVSSYLLRWDYNINQEKSIDTFSSYTQRMETNSDLQILYPGQYRQTDRVKDYVKTDYNEIEKALYSMDIYQGSQTYKDNINVDSFVDYYILQEFFCITDTFSGSTYLYRDVRGKLTAGPVWDYNNAFDNYMKSLPMNTFLLAEHAWFSRLLRDEEFGERVISRYHQLRSGVLTEERLRQYVFEVKGWLGGAIERNYKVWGYSFDPKQLSERTRRTPYSYEDLTFYDLNPSSYDEAIGQMVNCMIKRGRWMDENIEALRQYSHPSRNNQKELK